MNLTSSTYQLLLSHPLQSVAPRQQFLLTLQVGEAIYWYRAITAATADPENHNLPTLPFT